MRIWFRLLVAAFAILQCVSTVCAQDSNAAPASLSTLTEFQKLISEAKNDLAKSEADTKNVADKLAKAAGDTRPAAQQELDSAQAKLTGLRQKVATLEQAEGALHEQGPIRPVINQFKKERDALPATGTESQKAQRAEFDRKIMELEKADAALNNTLTQTGLSNWGVFAIVSAVILIAALLFGLGMLWIRASHAASAESGDDAVARVRLAKAVTLGAMTFIVLVSVVTLLCAGINAAVPPQDEKKTALFFDIAKWLLATVLPVVAAWVGGVMAYYFGKDNFKAGAENAEKLIKQLTPQQKLESQKAADAGLAIGGAAVSKLNPGDKLDDAKLDDLRAAFKTFERLPILDDKGCALGCLHLSTLNKYSEGLSTADKGDASKLTLGALMKKLNWKPEASFAAVSPTDNLGQAQSLMKASKECSDVFVTSDGTKQKPVVRWITNDDIMKIANA